MAGRVTQVAVEVLQGDDTTSALVTQVAVEVLRVVDGSSVRVTQVAVEVLMPAFAPPPPAAGRTQVVTAGMV